VYLDKTGTLSTAAPAVRAWRVAPAFRDREAWLRRAVAAAESGLRHPIAAALANPAVAGGRVCHISSDIPVRARERRVVPGLGVVAQVDGADGAAHELRVGDPRLGPEAGAGAPPVDAKAVVVWVDGARAATIELEEAWRAGMGEAVDELARLGLEVEILTGDPDAAPAVGPARVHAGLTPEAKRRRVAEQVAAGREVLFVGDGVNDAAAMGAAQGSVAMQAGAELAQAAAMAVFAGDDLRFLPRAIREARVIRRGIRVNLRLAAGYNLLGMALAASGQLHPVVAALLMVGSSALVSVNALRSVGAWRKAGPPAPG